MSSKLTLNCDHHSTYIKVFPLPKLWGKLLNIPHILSALLYFCQLSYVKTNSDLLQINCSQSSFQYNESQNALLNEDNLWCSVRALYSNGSHATIAPLLGAWQSVNGNNVHTLCIIWMSFFCLENCSKQSVNS